jgi:PAS domain S-box-containing protein
MSRAHLRSVPGAICVDAEVELQLEHQLILNAAGEGIYGLDLEGRATFVNPAAAAMTGHSVAELIGRTMHEVVHHSHHGGAAYSRRECPIYAAFHDGLMRTVDTEVFWRKDGSCFPVEYTSTPIIRRGKLIGAVVVFRDITVRKYTEERLKRALDDVQELERRLAADRDKALRRDRGAPSLIGSSRAMTRVLDLSRRAAASDVSVLVQGESGTGKELVCRRIHDLGPRHGAPFVSVNCAALAPTLLESELFGHERGAFTGATHQHFGCFELAEGGTLLLDEIAELPLEAQAKLLRVLQQREYRRVGGQKTLSTNARVIAATNRSLRELVESGRFRLDLYHRLHVFPILVPALRERREDVLPLAEHFLRRCEERWNQGVRGFSPTSLARLATYGFPGNVRELEHAIERSYLLSDTSHLDLDLDADAGIALSTTSVRLEDLEREHIERTLRSTHFKISGPGGAAEILDVHPNTLRSRMKKLGVTRRP